MLSIRKLKPFLNEFFYRTEEGALNGRAVNVDVTMQSVSRVVGVGCWRTDIVVDSLAFSVICSVLRREFYVPPMYDQLRCCCCCCIYG